MIRLERGARRGVEFAALFARVIAAPFEQRLRLFDLFFGGAEDGAAFDGATRVRVALCGV